MKRIARREFLRRAAAGAAGLSLPQIVPSSVLGRDGYIAPSNRIAIGFIGMGPQGVDMNLRNFLRQPDAQAVVVCDVDRGRMQAACELVNRQADQKGCAMQADFREVIARTDLDAVCISTPDHWHTPMSLMALRAGQDVICEKPTLTIAEGRVLSDTVRALGRVFQTATEDRSVFVYHRMAELVRNGLVGKLQRIEVGLPSGPGTPGNPTPQPVPADLDYDLWLGPAPWAPYCADRVHFNFRWISDYSGGMLTDWGAHLIDTAQWANNTEHSGPVTVEGTGQRFTDGLYDTFHNFALNYTYANDVTMEVKSGGVRLRFVGTDGWVGNRGWRGPVEASSPEILNALVGAEKQELYTCAGGEQRNFLDCVKSRRAPYFPAEIGHRCATVMHIGNIAMELGRKLTWNPEREEFVGDQVANSRRSRFMREPWTL